MKNLCVEIAHKLLQKKHTVLYVTETKRQATHAASELWKAMRKNQECYYYKFYNRNRIEHKNGSCVRFCSVEGMAAGCAAEHVSAIVFDGSPLPEKLKN